MTFSYNVSLSGLNAARYALQVTQNNIANVNTDGYARERVALSPNDVVLGGGISGQIGSGVSADQIERIKDNLLIEQVRTQGTRVSYYQTLEDGMSSIESVLGELKDGSLTNVMQDFFNSYEELSKYPMETSYREQVIGAAQQLSFKFNNTMQDLSSFKGELDNKLNVDIQHANDLIGQISNVNEEIKKASTEVPNALLDKRDALLDQLSQIGNVRLLVNPTDDRMVDVEFGGMMVVAGGTSTKIEGLYDQQNDKWVLSVGNVALRLENGSMLANLEVRNKEIPDNQNKLDELASAIINQVNTLHNSAFALDGTAGLNLFNGTNAKTIGINSAIQNNPDLLAISSVSTEKGNSDVARQLADLQDGTFMASGKNPIEDWTGFVVSKGQALNSVKDNATVYGNVLNDLKTQKQSVQGVDIDEELAKLMQYEKFYQSNAKVLQTIDGVFKDLLTMV